MGFFSDLATDLREDAITDTQLDSTARSVISAAEKRDDDRQQAEEDAAKAALSRLSAESDEDSDAPDEDECGDDSDESEDADSPDESGDADKTSSEADKAADEDKKRREHEEAEAKRKAEWEAKKQVREEAEQAAWENAVAMNDDEIMAASMKRIGDDAERLTRRNMKACVAEHIQTLCLEDADFARQVMHPRKNMINCFRYINRKAKAFIEQEMKDNDEKPLTNGVYGGDVPDDLCYMWAEDYFMDLDAEEDKEKEEKFVPKPYAGKPSAKSKKKPEKKKPEPKKPVPVVAKTDDGHIGQLSLLDAFQGVPA